MKDEPKIAQVEVGQESPCASPGGYRCMHCGTAHSTAVDCREPCGEPTEPKCEWRGPRWGDEFGAEKVGPRCSRHAPSGLTPLPCKPPRKTGAMQVACGTATGNSHRLAGLPNQDAHCVLRWSDRQGDPAFVAVVADGCSDGRFSQVGATLFARATAVAIRESLAMPVWGYESGVELVLDRARRIVVRQMHEVLDMLVPASHASKQTRHDAVVEYLLFTLVVAFEARGRFIIAHLGDGVAHVNGEPLPVPKYEDNAPAYLGYELTSSSTRGSLDFRVLADKPSEEVDSFLIGTDGVDELVALAGVPHPGQPEGATPDRRVPPLAELWSVDWPHRNPDMLNRRLRLVQGGVGHGARPGLIGDDVTIIVGRRSKE